MEAGASINTRTTTPSRHQTCQPGLKWRAQYVVERASTRAFHTVRNILTEHELLVTPSVFKLQIWFLHQNGVVFHQKSKSDMCKVWTVAGQEQEGKKMQKRCFYSWDPLWPPHCPQWIPSLFRKCLHVPSPSRALYSQFRTASNIAYGLHVCSPHSRLGPEQRILSCSHVT